MGTEQKTEQVTPSQKDSGLRSKDSKLSFSSEVTVFPKLWQTEQNTFHKVKCSGDRRRNLQWSPSLHAGHSHFTLWKYAGNGAQGTSGANFLQAEEQKHFRVSEREPQQGAESEGGWAKSTHSQEAPSREEEGGGKDSRCQESEVQWLRKGKVRWQLPHQSGSIQKSLRNSEQLTSHTRSKVLKVFSFRDNNGNLRNG